jgi:hypothetical protein
VSPAGKGSPELALATRGPDARTCAVILAMQAPGVPHSHSRLRHASSCEARRSRGSGTHCPILIVATCHHEPTSFGGGRRPIQRERETFAIPSRPAASVRVREARRATSRRVARSMSGIDVAAC